MEVNPRFTPVATMFKHELGESGHSPRRLECVNCKVPLERRIYDTAPEVFDESCASCGMSAEDYWRNKVHRKVETDA